jgi:type IV secretion system protein VirB2
MSISNTRTVPPTALLHNQWRAFAMLAFAMIALLIIANPAWAAAVNPAGSTQINDLVDWIRGTMLGAVATGVATIAVAGVGYMWLSGRLEFGRAMAIVVGVFVIFGSVAIVAGIRTITGTAA